MKNLDLNKVTNAVEKMCMEANFYLGSDVLNNLKKIAETEDSPVGKNILKQIVTNHAKVRSSFFKFVDDVEFYFPKDKNIIHIRSLARTGYSDFGVNRKRMEKIRVRFYE